MKYLETKNKYVPYALVAPAALIVLFVVFIPVLNAVLMSFQNYDLRRPQEIGFIGVKNYIDMFTDPLFWGALLRTIGQRARADVETLLGAKAYLDLWVKVRKDWRSKTGALRDFGFAEED